MQPHGQAKNLTGNAASYERDGGAATESAARNEDGRGNLIMRDSEYYNRTFENFENLIIASKKEKSSKFFANEARAERIVSWSESAEMSRASKASTKISDRKSKICAMINSRTATPSLTALKNAIKSENDRVAR